MHLCGTLAKEISDRIGLLVFFQGLYRAIAKVSATGKKCICRLHVCFLRVRSIQSRIPNSGHLETPEVKISISFLLRTLFAYSVKPRKKNKMTVGNPFANFSQSMQVIPCFMFEEFKKQLVQII